MKVKSIVPAFIFFLSLLIIMPSCKAKKCSNFDDAGNHKVKYNKGGLVKKKGGVAKPKWQTD